MTAQPDSPRNDFLRDIVDLMERRTPRSSIKQTFNRAEQPASDDDSTEVVLAREIIALRTTRPEIDPDRRAAANAAVAAVREIVGDTPINIRTGDSWSRVTIPGWIELGESWADYGESFSVRLYHLTPAAAELAGPLAETHYGFQSEFENVASDDLYAFVELVTAMRDTVTAAADSVATATMDLLTS